MSPHSTTLQKCASLLAFTAALLLSSCEEEVEEAKPLHVTIDLPEGYVVRSYSYFLSDEAGNVIDIQHLSNQEQIELRSPGPYTQKTYSITEFMIDTMEDKPYFVAKTYSGIEVKSLNWKTVLPFPDRQLTLFSFSGTSNVEFGAGSNDGDFQSLHDGSMLLGTRGNTTRLLAMVREPGTKQTRYRLFDNEGAGYATKNSLFHPHTIDLSLVTEPMPTRAISIPSGIINPTITVYGVKNKPAPEYYSIHRDFVSPDPLVIPDPGKVFDSYTYSTFFIIENNLRFHRNTRSSIDFTPMPVDISVEASGDNSLTFTTQGTYDFGTINFVSSAKSYYWEVYFPHSSKTRTVNPPAIPAELLEKLGSTTLGTFDQTVFGAADFKSIGGYQDFILKRDQTNSVGLESKSISIRIM